MIRIPFNPDALPAEQKQEFDNWRKLAAKAKSNQTAAKFQRRVWGLLKQWLLTNVFHSKCAYCENNIDAGFVGDAEHYRPKGAVTEMKNGKLVAVERDGVPHPGYYWLAYDWRNLVPSCERCNAVHGKRTQFPIQGVRVFDEATGPDTETLDRLERPILLHPYDSSRDPRDHLVFSPDGWVVGRDDVGKQSIKLLDLNRDALVNLRQRWISAQRGDFGNQLGYTVSKAAIVDLESKINEILTSFTSPDHVFSAAVRDVLTAILAQMPRQPQGS
jgi:hypothetical protein